MYMFEIDVITDEDGDIRLRQPNPQDDASFIFLTKDQAKIVGQWLIDLAEEE